MKTVLLFVLVMSSGCTSMKVYETVASEAAKEAATQQWNTSEAIYCRGNSTGALLRKSKSDARRFEEYCREVLQLQ
jgi:uncharacterized protein YceK